MATGIVRGMKARLDLKKIEQENEIEIIASVVGKDGPLKEIGLVFFLNTKPISEIKETDPFGRASVTLEKPAPGNYEITAQAIEGDLRESISLIVKKQREQTEEEKAEASLQHQLKISQLQRDLEETRKRVSSPPIIPDDFDARVIGERGRPIFVVDTFVKDKGGCKGEVAILEDETGLTWTFSTNENGKGTYPGPSDPLVLHTKDRTYIVRVAHVRKEEKFRLEGPPPRLLVPWWLLLICWLLVWGWFFFDYQVFGFQNPATLSTEYKAYAQMTGDEKFYYERRHRLQNIPLPKPPTAEQSGMELWYGWIGWWRWFLGFLFGIGITALALFNRVTRAWSRTQQRVWERREGVSLPIGSGQSTQEQSSSSLQTTAAETDLQRQYRRHFSFGWEMFREVFGEILGDFGLNTLKKWFSRP